MPSSPNFASLYLYFFFFNAPTASDIFTLSLHDALPIFGTRIRSRASGAQPQGGRTARLASPVWTTDRKSTRLNSSHMSISYAVFCLNKQKLKFPQTVLILTCNMKILLNAAKLYL